MQYHSVKMLRSPIHKFREAQLKIIDGVEVLINPKNNQVWCKKAEVGFLYYPLLSSWTVAGTATKEITESDWNSPFYKGKKILISYIDEYSHPEEYEGVPYMEGDDRALKINQKTIITFEWEA